MFHWPLTKPGLDCSDRIGLDYRSDRIGLAIRLKFKVTLKVIARWLLYDCKGRLKQRGVRRLLVNDNNVSDI